MKKLYWLIESNGDLSVTIEDITKAPGIIEADYKNECEGGIYSIDDFQYTITPQMLTQEQFEALGEAEF